jgi:CheY-like chemotaxis protein
MKRILLANQSGVTLELIKVYLFAPNLIVLDARDGIEALSIARTERPDLILCDLHLPRLDGPGLCRELRADPRLRNTPVIMIIGNRDPESLRLCDEAGARDILTRPIRPRELHDAVQTYAGIYIGLGQAPSASTGLLASPPPPAKSGFSTPTPAQATPKVLWSPSSKAS